MNSRIPPHFTNRLSGASAISAGAGRSSPAPSLSGPQPSRYIHHVHYRDFCTSPCSSRLRSQGSAAPAQVVTETLEAYGDDDDAVDVAKSGEQSCAGSRAPTAALPALLFVLALR